MGAYALVGLELRQQRAALTAWATGWVLLIALYAATWPSVRADAGRYEDLLASLPPALRTAFGTDAGLSTGAGYLTTELVGFTGPVLAVALGVVLGSRALAGKQEEGWLELLLAQPVERGRLLLALALSCAAAAACVLTAAGGALAVADVAVDLGLGAGAVVGTALLLWALAVEAAALALLAGAVTGRLALARAVPGAAAVLLFVLHALSGQVGALDRLSWLSPFGLLADARPLAGGPWPAALAGLLGPAAVLVAVAGRAFSRRDVL